MSGDPFLTEPQRRAYVALADRVVPADRWPSASGTGALAHLESLCPGGELSPGLRPASLDAVRAGLDALDASALHRFGHPFEATSARDQDALLRDVEAGAAVGWPVDPASFFAAAVRVVCEGYYGNPPAGDGPAPSAWEMVGFRDRIGAAAPRCEPLDEAYFDTTPPVALARRYDVVVVGSGAGGSVVAALASEAGRRVLVLERGEWLGDRAVGHDHLRNQRFTRCGTNAGPGGDEVRTLLGADGSERDVSPLDAAFQNNARTVGGGTRVFGAQAWRFHPDDFAMARRYGVPEGSSLSDWPLSYDDLEPYYDRAEWELGVSGDPGAHRGAGWRRRGYPMPPLGGGAGASRLAAGAEALGWEAGAVPFLVNSHARDGRLACARCAHCVGFACPTNAKNGAHNTVLRRALATGLAQLATGVAAVRVHSERPGSVSGVELAWEDGDGTTSRRVVGATHVVVAAGAVESARLLLNSAGADAPGGIGNAHDQVGRHLQGHVYTGALGRFPGVVEECLGPGPAIATRRFSHDLDAVGGGMLANDFVKMPVAYWALCLPPDAPRWGAAGKQAMRGYAHTLHVTGPVEEVPSPRSRVRLSRRARDRFGVPVAMFSGRVHPETLRTAAALRARAVEWLEAAGAEDVWSQPLPSADHLSGGQHQAGTLRMGVDPTTSVTDVLGRVHGYENLWVADGSVHVTNGGVNPVLTIFALAYRTAENVLESSSG